MNATPMAQTASGVSAAQATAGPMVDVRDLSVRFATAQGDARAVNGISFTVASGEVLGLIGESGCGKSVSLRALMRLLPAGRATIGGQIAVGGEDVLAMSPERLGAYRGGTAAMIFQDPGLALDPVYTVGQQISETVRRHLRCSRQEARERAWQMLEQVKVPSARARLDNYPHEMSGGMRQRVMIALALSCNPSLVLADEPTTALDATVQIQVLLIFRELQQRLGMSAIFVTHDLGVAAEICDRIAVMYAGRIVERGSAADILLSPRHPYTQALLASTIHGALRGQRIQGIGGAPPDITRLPAGCAFRERCPRAMDRCASVVPELVSDAQGHALACHADA